MFPQAANQENALQARGINPQTELPDSVTLSGDATSVRFHSSRKVGGYVKKEVDEYIVNVIAPSLEWFKSALEARDQEVYRLGKGIDELEQTISNLNRDIETVNMNNMILSSKRDNEDDKEMSALMNQNMELRRQIEELSLRGPVDSGEYDSLIESYRQNEEAYNSKINEMTEDMQRLEASLLAAQNAGTSEPKNSQLQAALEKCEILEKDLAEFQTYSDNINIYTNDLESKISELEAALVLANANDDATIQINNLNNKIVELEATLDTANTNDESLLNGLRRDLATAEDTVREHQQHIEKLKTELAEYGEEVGKKQEEIEFHKQELEKLASSVSEDNTEDYLEAYNTVLAQLNQTVEDANKGFAQYESQISTLQQDLDEAIERANEYYEHYIALQAQYEQPNYSEDSGESLINARNAELSTQLDELQRNYSEVENNYALLYAAYEELRANIPESGIVSMEDHASLKVSYDEQTAEMEKSQKRVDELEKEISKYKEGLLDQGVTIENYNEMSSELETAKYELHELKLKYDNLLAKKTTESNVSAPPTDDVTYTEEEYMAIYAHATEAVEEYNQLVSVNEEMRTAYEELRIAYEELLTNGSAPESPKAVKSKVGGLPIMPADTHSVKKESPVEANKYDEKKLPAGITIEDLT